MNISVGHKVKFINENLEGEIITVISEKRVVVSCSDGFDHEVSVSEIIIIGEDNEHMYKVDETVIATKITADNKGKVKKGLLSKYIETNRYRLGGVLEVDLHLEKIVEFPEKLDDSLRLHTQMQYVKNCLSAANAKNIRRIVFIHGVGTGVLKTELHNYLAGFENITITSADSREYGAGATEVIIKNS
ncbi:MAG: Smr/MutS family protein [Flavobacteriales bacterium]|nr:Smr/MutS family protein [Flavobacteriales bacterium]